MNYGKIMKKETWGGGCITFDLKLAILNQCGTQLWQKHRPTHTSVTQLYLYLFYIRKSILYYFLKQIFELFFHSFCHLFFC